MISYLKVVIIVYKDFEYNVNDVKTINTIKDYF